MVRARRYRFKRKPFTKQSDPNQTYMYAALNLETLAAELVKQLSLTGPARRYRFERKS